MKQFFLHTPVTDAAGSGDRPSEASDGSRLTPVGAVYITPDDGSTDETTPTPGINYSFCLNIANVGSVPSVPFFVRFRLAGQIHLEGGLNIPYSFDHEFTKDEGLSAGSTFRALAYFGAFQNEEASFQLEACVYLFNTNIPLICAKDFFFVIHPNNNSSGVGD